MEDSNMKRGFIQLSRAWYAESVMKTLPHDVTDEVVIGVYDDECGGTTSEFAIKWYDLGPHKPGQRPVPKLEIFDDAWDAAFNKFGAVLKELVLFDGKNIKPSQVCEILRVHGVEDMTKEER